MAGGKNTRMGMEKPMLLCHGKKLLDIACEAVINSGLECMVAISKNSQKTYEYAKKNYKTIETPGIDYCYDINFIYEFLREPFLTIASDLPFVTSNDIIEFLNDYKGKSMAGVILKENNYIYVGINIVSIERDDLIHIFKNDLLGINVNTPEDYKKYCESLNF